MLGVTAIGLFIIYYFTKKLYADNKFEGIYTGIKKVMANKYYIDEIYDAVISKPLHAISNSFYSFFDKTLIDGSVNGIGKFVNWSSDKLRYMQTGYTGFYMFAMVLSLVVFLIIGLFNII